MIEGECWESTFCKKAIGLVLLARFHIIIHCLASVVGARIAKSLDGGPKLIRRLFWDETKPSKHRMSPESISDVPLASETI